VRNYTLIIAKGRRLIWLSPKIVRMITKQVAPPAALDPGCCTPCDPVRLLGADLHGTFPPENMLLDHYALSPSSRVPSAVFFHQDHAAASRTVRFYRRGEREREFTQGDRIQFTAPDRNRRVATAS
jgi:hypothetical protein